MTTLALASQAQAKNIHSYLPCILSRLGDSLSYRNAERENKALALEARASKVVYPDRQAGVKDKENILPQSKCDTKVLRDTSSVSNATDSGIDESSSIQSLIEKMNKGLGVGIFCFICFSEY